MNRLLPAFVLLLVAACASTPPAPTLQGVITKIDHYNITVQPAVGDPASVTVARGTPVFWQNGTDAGRSVLTVGHPVQVWLAEGGKVTKIVIGN